MATATAPRDSLVTLTHVIYALHAASLVTGIIGAATVVGAFLTGWPSIIAVILNYAKRGDARGTWVDSHYRWQIRTFWFALLWFVIGWLFIFTFVGIVIGGPILAALTVWLIYRIARGWLRLRDRRPMYV
jgi:uncharacterized membrane protein